VAEFGKKNAGRFHHTTNPNHDPTPHFLASDRGCAPWRFTGFIFPPMDDQHNLRDLAFADADFSDAQFSGVADFRGSQFLGSVDFEDAKFRDKSYFIGTQFKGIADFSFCSLRNRMHFAGAKITPAAAILLWGLNFDRATHWISMDPGDRTGKLSDPIGQVVCRDIPELMEAGRPGGMGRVSFLHTAIIDERPYVLFENVHWERNPRSFIFDAQFVFPGTRRLGLPANKLEKLPKLFNADGSDLDTTMPLVRQDTERIAREIRKYYEAYGNYADAGDYYVAEMEYRRCREPWIPGKSFFTRLALESDKWVSKYGEAPSRSLICLLAIIFLSALAYLFTGFKFLDATHQRLWFVPGPALPTLADYGLAVLYAFANVVPGWFRPQTMGPACTATQVISIIQAILGIIVLTLFVLAIRRRFSR